MQTREAAQVLFNHFNQHKTQSRVTSVTRYRHFVNTMYEEMPSYNNRNWGDGNKTARKFSNNSWFSPEPISQDNSGIIGTSLGLSNKPIISCSAKNWYWVMHKHKHIQYIHTLYFTCISQQVKHIILFLFTFFIRTIHLSICKVNNAIPISWNQKDAIVTLTFMVSFILGKKVSVKLHFT